jgi:two-component system, OmpR family, phosphate regulon sensor histidine kinase PhoR
LSRFQLKKSALVASLFITAMVLLEVVLMSFEDSSGNKLLFITIATIVSFVAGYFIIGSAMDRYFFNKIRSIYRDILQLNSHTVKSIERKIPDEKLLAEISRLLIEWEKDNRKEIDHLKDLEEFRKEFLGNVSHELKTPIFTIQGYIHTLLDGGIDDHDVNILYLTKATRGIDRLISIVNDLESISKFEAGELLLEYRTFDITELITEVIESLELRTAENKVSLGVNKDTEIPLYVYADKDRIRQVLVNLLVNSIKYGKFQGTTTISVSDHNNLIVIDVADDGIGIEGRHLNRLFERFYRVDKSRSREQGGTGLGLAIVKHIIEAHKQKISVDSTFGKGTTFTFTLEKSE